MHNIFIANFMNKIPVIQIQMPKCQAPKCGAADLAMRGSEPRDAGGRVSECKDLDSKIKKLEPMTMAPRESKNPADGHVHTGYTAERVDALLRNELSEEPTMDADERA